MNIVTKFFAKAKSFLQKPIFSTYLLSWGWGKKLTNKDYYYGIVYSCIDAIATNVSATRFHLADKRDEKKKNVYSHPALDLLYKPNEFQTGLDFLYLISSHIDAFGRAYIYPVFNSSRQNRFPIELYLLDPARTNPVTGEANELIMGYTFINGKGRKIPFAPNELIEIKRPNPYNQIEGASTIEMARHEIEGDMYAVEWNKNIFINGAMPSGVLTTEQSLGEKSFERLRQQWKERYQGVENAHKPLILEGGLKWQQLSLQQKDMDFVEQRRFSRDAILSIFKVPKTLVAIADDVNRANAETAKYVFAENVILPRLRLIFDKLNRFYVPLFPNTDSLQLSFEDPVPQNTEMNIKRRESGLKSGYYTINEVRSEEGKEPVEGGDTPLVAFNLVPLTDVINKTSDNGSGAKSISNKKEPNHADIMEEFLTKMEAKYRKKVDALFKELTAQIRNKKPSKTVKKDTNDPLVDEIIAEIYPDTTDWQKMYGTITFDFGIKTSIEASKQVALTYGIDAMTDGSLKKVTDWLKNHIKDSTKSINDTLYNRAREVIARNLADQVVDIGVIRDEVAQVIDDERDWRVERIVRTELFTAYSQAAQETYRQNNVERVKWFAAADERTCPICMLNHLKVVKLDAPFPSGSTVAPAHIQCRCVTVVTSDELT